MLEVRAVGECPGRNDPGEYEKRGCCAPGARPLRGCTAAKGERLREAGRQLPEGEGGAALVLAL